MQYLVNIGLISLALLLVMKILNRNFLTKFVNKHVKKSILMTPTVNGLLASCYKMSFSDNLTFFIVFSHQLYMFKATKT